jgi:hypothetical protein
MTCLLPRFKLFGLPGLAVSLKFPLSLLLLFGYDFGTDDDDSHK